jgi:hypothetical protein
VIKEVSQSISMGLWVSQPVLSHMAPCMCWGGGAQTLYKEYHILTINKRI